MAFFSARKEPMSASDLSHITRGLQQAAAATQNLIAQQYIKLFDQFFDYDIDELGTPMKAKMVEVQLDEHHSMSVPLIALVAPKGQSGCMAPSKRRPVMTWRMANCRVTGSSLPSAKRNERPMIEIRMKCKSAWSSKHVNHQKAFSA